MFLWTDCYMLLKIKIVEPAITHLHALHRLGQA